MRSFGSLRSAAGWLGRRSAVLLLVVTAAGLAAGGVAWLAGAGAVADGCWLVSAGFGLVYALWSAADSLRRGRLGVDVIALLALAGAVAVRELLAAAVISVMLASGRALEAWAALRARHDLSALLDRAPRTARRGPRAADRASLPGSRRRRRAARCRRAGRPAPCGVG